MRITSKITPAVIQAATAMLSPYVPEISPTGLAEALKSYQNAPQEDTRRKPYTRDEVAALLGVSLMSINRYLNEGRLKRIKIGKRAVRINAGSVAALLDGAAAPQTATPGAMEA